MTGSTGEVMAQHIYDTLEEFDSLESIRAILVATPLSTEAGRIVWLSN